jgi:hypothetical protein
MVSAALPLLPLLYAYPSRLIVAVVTVFICMHQLQQCANMLAVIQHMIARSTLLYVQWYGASGNIHSFLLYVQNSGRIICVP